MPRKTPAPPKPVGRKAATIEATLAAVAQMIPAMAAEWSPAEPLAVDAPEGDHVAGGWRISVEAGRVVAARRA